MTKLISDSEILNYFFINSYTSSYISFAEVPLNLILVPLTQKSEGVKFSSSNYFKLLFMHLLTTNKQKKVIIVAKHKIIAEFWIYFVLSWKLTKVAVILVLFAVTFKDNLGLLET